MTMRLQIKDLGTDLIDDNNSNNEQEEHDIRLPSYIRQQLTSEETAGRMEWVSFSDVDDPYHARRDSSKSRLMHLRAWLSLPMAMGRFATIATMVAGMTLLNQSIMWCSGASSYSQLNGWSKSLFDGVFRYGSRFCVLVLGVWRIRRLEVSPAMFKVLQDTVRSRPYDHHHDHHGMDGSGSGSGSEKQQQQQEEDQKQLQSTSSSPATSTTPSSHSSVQIDRELCEKSAHVSPPAIVVSNHVTSFDSFMLTQVLGSFTAVAKAEVKQTILSGASKMMEVLFLDRNNKSKIIFDIFERTKQYLNHMLHRVKSAHDARPAPLLIFPEGTTTSGHMMLKFNTGVFRIGAPILPVVLRFPYRYFNVGWTRELPAYKYFMIHYCQFVIPATIVTFPNYVPNEQERSDARFYAENVRRVMAAGANLVCTDMSPLTLHHKLFGRFAQGKTDDGHSSGNSNNKTTTATPVDKVKSE